MEERAAEPGPWAVLSVDLDGFRCLNDTLGHAAGDRVLVAAAERIAATLRPSDSLARIGPDEFGVLCRHVGSDQDGFAVAERLIATVEALETVAGSGVHVGASVGMSFSWSGAESGRMLQLAERAQLGARALGGNRWATAPVEEQTATRQPRLRSRD